MQVFVGSQRGPSDFKGEPNAWGQVELSLGGTVGLESALKLLSYYEGPVKLVSLSLSLFLLLVKIGAFTLLLRCEGRTEMTHVWSAAAAQKDSSWISR